MTIPRKPTIYDRTDGTVLDEMTRREFKAAWDAQSGRDQIICSPQQADKARRDLLALAADASDSPGVQSGAPLRGGPPIVTVSDSPRGYTIRIPIDAGDRIIVEAARRLTGKLDAEEVVKALGRHHVREVDQIPYALGLRDGEDFPPEMREAIGQRFGLVPPSSLASRPYNPSRELRWNDPMCAALVAHGATEAQACEELAKALRVANADLARLLERRVEPMVVKLSDGDPWARKTPDSPIDDLRSVARDMAKPAGRWTVSHPDPATKARIEADLNATGGSFTVPKEPGVFTIRHTVHSTSTPLVNPTNEEAERAFGKHSWAADAVKWANARLPGEMAAIEAIADRMGVELCNPATPALEHVTGASPNYTTNTFLGTAADLRRLHDAIGQAIETGAARIESYRGGPVTITRDEMLFSPTVTMDAPGGLPATVAIAADAKHLRLLRDAVDEARATGKAPPRDWGKRRKVAVERVGEAPTVAEPPSEAEPVRYDGGHGGAQAWRWEVGE